jgi:KH domain
VPAWDEVGTLLQALEGVVPTRADVSSIRFSPDARGLTILTRTPGLIIGRRGSTAALIKDALSEASGADIELRIEEVKEPPEDPLGGVREPRDPFPLEPEVGVRLTEAGGEETVDS